MADPTSAADDDTSEDTTGPEVEVEPAVDMAYGVPVTSSRGQQVLHPGRDTYVDTVRALRGDGFVMCIDVTAVDYLEEPIRHLPAGVAPERYEVVASFINHADARRVRIRVQVPADDPTVATLFDEFPGSEALEREVYDMFGISFDGHPDMSRILMPDDWEGHPLRKDYGVGTVPVAFKASPEAAR